jgi:tRNA pseudouridine55 synthase
MMGALLIDKPAGLSSHDVVRRVRKALGTRAVGHTGTLDPFATGLLVVLTGRATRLARFVERQDKTYRATLRLGSDTDSDDLTGVVVRQVEVREWPAGDAVESALEGQLGSTLQRPPAFSAKHVGGERSYRLARRGEAVELAPVSIAVRRCALLRYEPPEVEFRATVSAGTYVRALGRDLGATLGTGGHLVELRREAIGQLVVEDAMPVEQLVPGVEVLPAASVLQHLARHHLAEEEVAAIRHGRAIAAAPGSGEGEVALMAEGSLLAVARCVSGMLHPVVVLAGA